MAAHVENLTDLMSVTFITKEDLHKNNFQFADEVSSQVDSICDGIERGVKRVLYFDCISHAVIVHIGSIYIGIALISTENNKIEVLYLCGKKGFGAGKLALKAIEEFAVFNEMDMVSLESLTEVQSFYMRRGYFPTDNPCEEPMILNDNFDNMSKCIKPGIKPFYTIKEKVPISKITGKTMDEILQNIESENFILDSENDRNFIKSEFDSDKMKKAIDISNYFIKLSIFNETIGCALLKELEDEVDSSKYGIEDHYIDKNIKSFYMISMCGDNLLGIGGIILKTVENFLRSSYVSYIHSMVELKDLDSYIQMGFKMMNVGMDEPTIVKGGLVHIVKELTPDENVSNKRTRID